MHKPPDNQTIGDPSHAETEGRRINVSFFLCAGCSGANRFLLIMADAFLLVFCGRNCVVLRVFCFLTAAPDGEKRFVEHGCSLCWVLGVPMGEGGEGC
jgi:hypothetical protein